MSNNDNQMWDNDKPWGNTKLSTWIMLTLCVAISVGFGISSFGSFENLGAFRIGEFIGIALFPFIVAGVIPLIWWGIVRFRYDRSFGPFVLWLVLVVVVSYMANTGRKYNLAIREGRSPLPQNTSYSPPGCEFEVTFDSPTQDQDYSAGNQPIYSRFSAASGHFTRAECIVTYTSIGKSGLRRGLESAMAKDGVQNLEIRESGERLIFKGSKIVDGAQATYVGIGQVGNESVIVLTGIYEAKKSSQDRVEKFLQTLRRVR